MYGKSQWIGIESEGRLSDVKTLFIRKGELPIGWAKYPHIYFTIEFVRNAIPTHDWHAPLDVLENSNATVTLETSEDTFDNLPLSLCNRVHLIYRIQDTKGHINKLKQFDTISIDHGWYRCTQITHGNCTKTSPDNYKYDQAIKP